MSFQNLYYKRTAATAKACYVCYRPTTTVLATVNTIDFIYTCPGHLSDPAFASRVSDTSGNVEKSKQVTPEAIAKVKEEWEEKQRRKKEKEEKEKENGGKDDKKDGEASKEKKSPTSASSSTVRTPSTPSTPTPTHERYILHRDFFSMRQAEHRKRRQAAEAKELAPRLPGAPKDPIS